MRGVCAGGYRDIILACYPCAVGCCTATSTQAQRNRKDLGQKRPQREGVQKRKAEGRLSLTSFVIISNPSGGLTVPGLERVRERCLWVRILGVGGDDWRDSETRIGFQRRARQ